MAVGIQDRVYWKSLLASSFTLHLLLWCCVDASVHEYAGERFAKEGNGFVFHGGSEGLHASLHNTSNIGDSFIRFEKITFRRPKETIASKKDTTPLSVAAVVFELKDSDTIGRVVAKGGQRAICCTSNMAKSGACTLGTLTYHRSINNPGWPKVITASFKSSDPVATLPSQTIKITSTRMYSLNFFFCDQRLNGLEITGKTIWKNPTGYLPGMMAPLMKLYAFMSIAFAIIGILWFLQNSRFWTEVMPIQNCITLVIALGMLEMVLKYYEYDEFNKTGYRSTGITFWAVTLGAVRATVSRVAILIVSMGFGVVKPILNGLTSKVIMLGAMFFLALEVLELLDNFGTISDLSANRRLFLVLLAAITEVFFITWILSSLSNTLNKLQAKRMMAKLEIYRKLKNILLVAVIISVGWNFYELHFNSKNRNNELWQSAWIIPTFWQLLSFSLLCAICILWAPSQYTIRYTYSDYTDEDFDQEEGFTYKFRTTLEDGSNVRFT